MHQDIQRVCEVLDLLADATVATFPHQTDLPFTEYWSWQVPSMNRMDLPLMVKSIADDLRLANPSLRCRHLQIIPIGQDGAEKTLTLQG